MSRFFFGLAWVFYGLNVLGGKSFVGGMTDGLRADMMATACFFLVLSLHYRKPEAK